jgi:putative toxin-antitoxin system antitoxin component (TIGR02293 family)
MPWVTGDYGPMEIQMGTAASLLVLISAFPCLRGKGLMRQVIGISERALKAKFAKDSDTKLTFEQSKRAQQLLEILSHATKVMGSDAAADAWMKRKAVGLGNKVPLEMMLTQEGCLALHEYLVRVGYGVYC